MAGGKKKKKPATNPARGFATTSIASKPKFGVEDAGALPTQRAELKDDTQADRDTPTLTPFKSDALPPAQDTLSAEEFEKQLENSELQVLVDKHAQKVKRDALRQQSRLEIDRRVLRGQAENVNTRKWLPSELTDEILDLIEAEGRYVGQSQDANNAPKNISEEDLTIRLWTLHLALIGAGFLEERVLQALHYVLEISNRVTSGKDMIWGLEDSLEWLARECSKLELPEYEENRRRKAGTQFTPQNVGSPLVSGTTTPRNEQDTRHTNVSITNGSSNAALVKKKELGRKIMTEYDSDIDPDDLLPIYIESKEKLFKWQKQEGILTNGRKNGRSKSNSAQKLDSIAEPDIAKALRKIKRIESDILFDQYLADQKWEPRRIELEKEAVAAKHAIKVNQDQLNSNESEASIDSDDEISNEAARVGAEILAEHSSDDDEALADLFASLPVNEVDPATGKSSTVINGSDGVKVTIRDFGTWTGVSPMRILEEACRARDSSSKIKYNAISASSFSNRHSVAISWSKAQEPLPSDPPSSISHEWYSKSNTFSMMSISTPDQKQSEAFVATTALFYIFGSSSKEDKVFLRLPATWRDLWTEYADLKKELSDEADRLSIRRFRAMVREKRDRELEDGVLIQGAFRGRASGRGQENRDDSTEKLVRSQHDPDLYKRIWAEKSSSPSYKSMLRSRMQLPMWSFKDQVLESMEREQVIIVCGETGCGKSTQVPTFILEHELSHGRPCKIYCTEPRRISAISLARRVSEELGERKNDLGTPRSLIGYAIRLESNTSKETRLTFATTGIVMRMLEGSNDLKDVTHIVLDEVHERTIDSDFLLIILRKLMVRRPDLKVILMSATVDAQRFSTYLNGAPVLNVPGRTFPVQVKYLEDAVELTGYTLGNNVDERFADLDEDLDVAEAGNDDSIKANYAKELRGYSNRTRNTIAQIDEYRIEFDLIVRLIQKVATDDQLSVFSKAILVFLPGIGEIRQLNDMLLGHPAFSSDWMVYPLHSTIASEDQEAAFLVPPPGIRKIVLATNIAETGITIPDVTCVIDTGKHREMRFDERRQLSRLLETFISKANAKQRRGRAGRVQEGVCFHLFTKYRHDQLIADQQTPELLRLSLQDLAIRVKICKLGAIEETLSEALDPPSAKNIRRAIDALIDVRALTPGEDLTPLGTQLAKLPLDVFLGKLILLGAAFKCLDATITIAAILSSKSPFSAPFGARAQADTVRLAFRRGDSDLLTVYNAYLAWKRVCINGTGEYQFCRKNFLAQQTLSNIEELKGQLLVCLVDSGFLPLTEIERTTLNRTRFSHKRRQFFDVPQRADLNSDNDIITASIIGWSFYPKLLVKDGKGFRSCSNNQSISLHPSSVNKERSELKWLSYYHIMQAKQFYNAHETTAVDEFAIALLCGDVRCDAYAGVFILDGNRARFAVSDWKAMLIIRTLRSRIRDILTRSFKNPGKPITAQQQKWMDILQKIFSQDFKDTR